MRVRPSVGALRVSAPAAAAASAGAPPFAPGWAEPAPLRDSRRMQDGHWTLAFDDAQTCREALALVQAEAERTRSASGHVLEALLLAVRAEVPSDSAGAQGDGDAQREVWADAAEALGEADCAEEAAQTTSAGDHDPPGESGESGQCGDATRL